MNYNQVKIQPLPGNKYLVLEDIIFKDVVVPKNFKTNGADVPRLLWSIYPPNKSDFLPAVIIHDYLCEKGEYKKADDLFEECLELLGVRSRDRFILTKSVRLYHKIKYKI